MKKILLLAAIIVISNSAFSQSVESPRITAEGKNVKISYGQPSKRDRIIFGRLVPYGEVWRTGANGATEITFTKNAIFGGKPVKAGTYTLFTIPGEKKWMFILNSELGQWGAFKYNEIKGKDVLQVTVPASSVKGTAVEKLTITLPSNKLVLEWDKTRVEVPVRS
ncbi:DUF2911 domain-containing protein [Chitinophaga sp. GCM10012297]|uniref:DUF2911 domain-containing protein n=1 Tax=Chitinophaga chungangae TaxID=2821488 RepID=A0ABS3YG29_9BACT|nr:DUF2911 domain-containing protein [Chitinophaga chungangae]MBO9153637.1 DUF2911 domain-containing protein [Chitinophaga chungangae]